MAYNIKDYEQVSVSTDAILLAYDEQEGLKAIVMRRPSTEEFLLTSSHLLADSPIKATTLLTSVSIRSNAKLI